MEENEEKNDEVIKEETKEEIQEEKNETIQSGSTGNGFAVAGMVLGIVALCISFISFFELITEACAIIALIFAIISLVKKSGKGQAIAAIVLSVLAIVVIVNRHITYRRTVDTITFGIKGITNSFTDSWDKVTDTFTNNAGKVQNSFTDGMNKAQEAFTNSTTKVQESITESANVIQESINESINKMQESFKADENSNDKMTMDKYNKIEMGMTYDQVVEIIGSEGNLLTDASSINYSLKMYSWPSSNGLSNATITFTNGAVTAKSQIGLYSY